MTIRFNFNELSDNVGYYATWVRYWQMVSYVRR